MSLARSATRSIPGIARHPLPRLGAALLVVLGVVALTVAVINTGGPLPGDVVMTQFTQDMLGGWFSPVAHLFNHQAHDFVIPTLAMLSIGGALARRRFDLALVFAFFLVAGLFVSNLKEFVDRPRPAGDFLISETSSTFSFPSGHTIRSAAFFGSWFIVAPRILSARPAGLIRSVAVVAIILTAVSRVWVGVHWTTDVLAAVAIATVALSALSAGLPLLERLNANLNVALDRRFRPEANLEPAPERG